MAIRGIRGATTVENNAESEILSATTELLESLFESNSISREDIASIFFSVTQDLDAVFPAKAARELGLTDTPLLCLNEVAVQNSIKRCIRILIHVNTEKLQSEVTPVYLRRSDKLRPEFAPKNNDD